MTKKLEEMFDLEPTDTAESMGEKLQKEQESKDDVEALDLIQQKVGLDKIVVQTKVIQMGKLRLLQLHQKTRQKLKNTV